ncbi:hypothetical protein HPB48_004568 [Haemaphysalis longicornis]|uniref:ABC transmembrane type-1 domain-containing protein n=1 Tax=Haemaphysalis longicornis TaxID=44386 RepID=A0A9J6GUH0_HAELO|nr:hypothetical protein HPB48_004568 [Haemaphysalis longicornis]
MFVYLWPKEKPEIRTRVVIALGILILAKVINIGVPFIFKAAVDYLNEHTGSHLTLADASSTLTSAAFALLVGYGLARAGAAGFNELRNAVFAKVAHHSIREVARRLFLHLHQLDLNFHLSRQTGALSKAIDRGTSQKESTPAFCYPLHCIVAPNYFNNEKYEVQNYDKLLAEYQEASLKTTTSLALLNFGQNAIFSASLSAIMLLASQNILNGGSCADPGYTCTTRQLSIESRTLAHKCALCVHLKKEENGAQTRRIPANSPILSGRLLNFDKVS